MEGSGRIDSERWEAVLGEGRVVPWGLRVSVACRGSESLGVGQGVSAGLVQWPALGCPLNPKLAGDPGIRTCGRPAVTRGPGGLAIEGVYGEGVKGGAERRLGRRSHCGRTEAPASVTSSAALTPSAALPRAVATHSHLRGCVPV